MKWIKKITKINIDLKPLAALILGIIASAVLTNYVDNISFIGKIFDTFVLFSLYALLFVIGLDMGRDEKVWGALKKLKGPVVLFPFVVVLGSIAGGVLLGSLTGAPINIAAAASAGCGYYSLTTLLMKQISGPEGAAVGMLANLMREAAILTAMPIIVKLFGGAGAAGAAGATAMDTALPFIVKYAPKETALLAFVSGVILTIITPFTIPAVYKLFSFF